MEGPCMNCRAVVPGLGAKKTARWKLHMFGERDHQVPRRHCDACNLNAGKGKFCPYDDCWAIYSNRGNPYMRRDGTNDTSQKWVRCSEDTCRRWVHTKCAVKGGEYPGQGSYHCVAFDHIVRARASSRKGQAVLARTPVEDGALERKKLSRNLKGKQLARSPRSKRALFRDDVPKGGFNQCTASYKMEVEPLRKYARINHLKERGRDVESLRTAVVEHWNEMILPEEPRDFLRLFMENMAMRKKRKNQV